MDVYLGVDVGSTSTKAAVVNANGEVLAKSYLMTAGQPLEAIKQVMAQLAPVGRGQGAGDGDVGVTGSGRYLVGSFIGADLIKNEITAQTRAALQIDPRGRHHLRAWRPGLQVRLPAERHGARLPDEQGLRGRHRQLHRRAGRAAGGLHPHAASSRRLAFDAGSLLDLGEKCTAFMSQAVTSAQHAGVSMETIVASLSTSLAKNYRSKVVSGRKVGEHIFLTGAVFYNDAVVAAFRAEFPGKTFIVPVHKEVTGAIGAALLAAEALPAGPQSGFKGFAAMAEASTS